MLKRKHFRFVSTVVVLVAMFIFVLPASAAGESVTHDSFDTTFCSPGSPATGVFTVDMGTAGSFIQATLTNNSKGTSVTGGFGAISDTYNWWIIVPASTEEGDSMTLTLEVKDAGNVTLASALLGYECGIPWGTTGGDMTEMPSDAVVGRFVANTAIMYAPGVVSDPPIVMEMGKTAWVLGMDDSGMYYKVLLSGQSFWVPVSSMGPNYDEVWNGTPLPATTVD